MSAKRTLEVADGVKLALGKQLDPSFYHAIAANPEEAEQMLYHAKTRQREASIIASKWGAR